jgi:hypothetical protein
MARKKGVQTFTQERQLAGLATVPGRHRDEKHPGLYLQVIEATQKPGKPKEYRVSWLLRYQLHGRERWAGLGPLKLVPLRDAREKWRAARQQLLDGIDPLKAKSRRACRTREGGSGNRVIRGGCAGIL